MILTNGMNKTKLALVDLDGTLINNLDSNFRAYKIALNESGYDITKTQYAEQCDGRSYKDFLPEIVGEDKLSIKIIHERKKELYTQCLKYAKVNYHLEYILRAIKPEYYIALVTTASRENVDNILTYFDLTSLFDIIVTHEDMVYCKPAPDCYIDTRNKFGISIENTIIFEDSATGMKAAQESGCNVFCYKQFMQI